MSEQSGLSISEFLRFFERVSVFVTGRSSKDYKAVVPNESISISGEKRSLESIAAGYAPVLYVHPRLGPMRPRKIIYDAVHSSSGVLLLNFYVFWEDEIHPNPLWHAIYREFRKVLYGSEKDIEFIQVGIDTITADVIRIAFERDPSNRPDAPSPLHNRIIAARNGSGNEFSVTVEGEPSVPVAVTFRGRRPHIFVATWNHTHDFYTGVGDFIPDPPLEYMDDEAFSRWCMLRRSRPPDLS